MSEDIDSELAKIEEEIRQYEENPTPTGSTLGTSKNKDDIFTFARELIKSKDTRKFGFLDSKHIGIPRMPINKYLEIADFCDIHKMNILGNVFRQEAENALATSLSIKGFLPKLLVTQIKKDSKVPSSPTTVKTGFWGKKTNEVQPQDD